MKLVMNVLILVMKCLYFLECYEIQDYNFTTVVILA